jgi:hypothetical protein
MSQYSESLSTPEGFDQFRRQVGGNDDDLQSSVIDSVFDKDSLYCDMIYIYPRKEF